MADLDKLSLRKFKIKTMIPNASILLLGMRRTGKSFLVRDIFYHHKNIPKGIVFSGTEDANPFFGDFIPDCLIHTEYDSGIINYLMKKQTGKVRTAIKNGHKKENGCIPSNRAFVVLDDMLHDAKSWSKDKVIKEIFMNGRHKNIFFILTMQYSMGIGPILRSNIDYVFIFNTPSIKNRKKIYEEYAAMIPSFEYFCNILDSCTQNFECLVIRQTNNTNDLKDQVFWYKAEYHADFKVGHKSIWDYHDSYYNAAYEEDGNDEEDKINELKRKFGHKKLKVIVDRQSGTIVNEEIF